MPSRVPGHRKLRCQASRTVFAEVIYVIGDRLTDMELAKNLGTRGIWIQTGAVAPDPKELKAKGLTETVVLSAQGWEEVARYLVEGA